MPETIKWKQDKFSAPIELKRPDVQCEFCPAKFYTKKGLKMHLTEFHKIVKTKTTQTPSIKTQTARQARNARFYKAHKENILKSQAFYRWEKKNTVNKAHKIEETGVKSSNESTSQ